MTLVSSPTLPNLLTFSVNVISLRFEFINNLIPYFMLHFFVVILFLTNQQTL